MTEYPVENIFSNEIKNESLEEENIGELHLSSGKVVTCDPLVYHDPKPFVDSVPSGKYPVILHYSEGSIAYAELRISNNHVEKWKLATTDNQDISTLKENEIFGFPVDAGLGCFMDEETLKILEWHATQLEEEIENYNNYFDDYLDDILEDSHYCINKPFDNIDNNVIIFESGWGDGFYPTYIGFDKENNPVKYIIEFINIEDKSHQQ